MMSEARSARLLLAACLVPSLAYTASLDGRWEGAIHAAGRELPIAVTMRTTAGGPEATIDIPQQNVSGLRLTNVKVGAETAYFEMAAGTAMAVFDGKVKDGVIAGAFRQGGFEGTFELRPASPTAEFPTPPYPGEDVRVASGDATLACTLTRPSEGGRFPGVVLLTGSGAQNRDEEIFGFKPFRLIADHLSARGVVALRCDDRGVGGSTPPSPSTTSVDSALDALALVRYLRSRSEVVPEKVGILGHSIGGAEAVLAAVRAKDLAFVVTLAGPMVSGEMLVRTQLAAMARAEGQSATAIEEALAQQELAFKVAHTGEGAEPFVALLKEQRLKQLRALPEEQRKAITNPEQLAEATARQGVATLRSAWYRFMLDYDPAQDLARFDCPILAIYGDKDVQVDAEMNRRAFEKAVARAGRKRAKAVVIGGANHLFQPNAKTGSVSEYALLPKQFAPGVLEAINGFISEVTR